MWCELIKDDEELMNLENLKKSYEKSQRELASAKDDLKEIIQEINYLRSRVDDDDENLAVCHKDRDDLEGCVSDLEEKVLQIEWDYYFAFKDVLERIFVNNGWSICASNIASTGTKYYSLSKFNSSTDVDDYLKIRLAGHSRCYDCDYNVDFGLESNNWDGGSLADLDKFLIKRN